jgi:cytochrome d ubiquinol oxidase subunit II
VSWPLAALAVGGLVAAALQHRRGRERAAFLGSCAFLAGLLGATAAGLYPDLLRSTLGEAHSLTAQNTAASTHGLSVGLGWWLIGIPLAAAYFTYLFRSFAGKVA